MKKNTTAREIDPAKADVCPPKKSPSCPNSVSEKAGGDKEKEKLLLRMSIRLKAGMIARIAGITISTPSQNGVFFLKS